MLLRMSGDHVLVVEQVFVQRAYLNLPIDQKLQPVRRRLSIFPAM